MPKALWSHPVFRLWAGPFLPEISGRPLCPSTSCEVVGGVRQPPLLCPELFGPSRAAPDWLPFRILAGQEGSRQILPTPDCTNLAPALLAV